MPPKHKRFFFNKTKFTPTFRDLSMVRSEHLVLLGLDLSSKHNFDRYIECLTTVSMLAHLAPGYNEYSGALQTQAF